MSSHPKPPRPISPRRRHDRPVAAGSAPEDSLHPISPTGGRTARAPVITQLPALVVATQDSWATTTEAAQRRAEDGHGSLSRHTTSDHMLRFDLMNHSPAAVIVADATWQKWALRVAALAIIGLLFYLAYTIFRQSQQVRPQYALPESDAHLAGEGRMASSKWAASVEHTASELEPSPSPPTARLRPVPAWPAEPSRPAETEDPLGALHVPADIRVSAEWMRHVEDYPETGMGQSHSRDTTREAGSSEWRIDLKELDLESYPSTGDAAGIGDVRAQIDRRPLRVSERVKRDTPHVRLTGNIEEYSSH